MKKSCFLVALIFIFAYSLSSWETAIAGVLTTPPAQGRDFRIYSTADDRALHCLDGTTGKEYWNFRTGRRLGGFTVVSPDHSILIMTVQNVLISVSPGGRELWRLQLNKAPDFPPSVDPFGFIYLVFDSDSLVSIDRNGVQTWHRKLDFTIKNLFSTNEKLFVFGAGRTVLLNLDGSNYGEINSVPRHVVYISPHLYWQLDSGTFTEVDPQFSTLNVSENPLPAQTRFPEPEVLISYENKIISGRKDWFMEAMEEGESSFNPFYQSGNNPGRTKSINELPGSASRYDDFASRGGAPLLPLLNIDPLYLDRILNRFEKADSLQSVLKIDPDYDLLFQRILSDSHVVTLDVNRPRLDEYSRYRIYGVLSRWGNLNSRETLLSLSEAEKSSHNLMMIMDGLGRIGLDDDHRSMDVIIKIADRYSGNDSVIITAIKNASLLARYNGGRSILEMMDFYNTLQQRQISSDLLKQIHRELNSF